MNILTASPHSMLDVCLKRLGIYDYFSIDMPIEKILFLDDNYNACKTAKSSGMKVCGVFDESSSEYVDDMKSIADIYIYDFSELLEI